MSLYFIAVVPNKQITKKARAVSKDFAERFNSVKSFKNFPHITLIKPFSFDENKEDELVDKFSEMDLKQLLLLLILIISDVFLTKIIRLFLSHLKIRKNFKSCTMKFSRI